MGDLPGGPQVEGDAGDDLAQHPAVLPGEVEIAERIFLFRSIVQKAAAAQTP